MLQPLGFPGTDRPHLDDRAAGEMISSGTREQQFADDGRVSQHQNDARGGANRRVGMICDMQPGIFQVHHFFASAVVHMHLMPGRLEAFGHRPPHQPSPYERNIHV